MNNDSTDQEKMLIENRRELLEQTYDHESRLDALVLASETRGDAVYISFVPSSKNAEYLDVTVHIDTLPIAGGTVRKIRIRETLKAVFDTLMENLE